MVLKLKVIPTTATSPRLQQETDGTFREVIHGRINEGAIYKGVHGVKGNRDRIVKRPEDSRIRKASAAP